MASDLKIESSSPCDQQSFVLFSLDKDPVNNALLQDLPDARIKVGDDYFPTHKRILKGSSPVFEAFFSGNWHADDEICELHDRYIDPAIVNDLLDLFYTAKLKITPQNAHSLLIAAHFLHIPPLINATQKFLVERFSTDGILDIYLWSKWIGFEFDDLQGQCFEFISKNCEEVLKDDRLLSFSVRELKSFINVLRKWKRNCRMNELIYESLIRWTEHNSDSREFLFPDLFKPLRSATFSAQFVTKQAGEKYSEHLLDVQTKSFQCCSFGTTVDVYQISSSLSSSIQGDQCSQSPCPQISETFSASTVVGRKVYMFGGLRFTLGENEEFSDVIKVQNRPRAEVTSAAHVFDSSTKTWSSLSPMPEPRYQAAAAELNGSIYVSGGRVSNQNDSLENEALSTVLRYDIATDSWHRDVAPMPGPAIQHRMFELGGYLYVLGGYHNKYMERLPSLKRYDPQTNEWSTMSDMNFLHTHWSKPWEAVKHNGRIYVLSANAFEEFTPETDTWKVLPEFPTSFAGSLLSIDGELLATIHLKSKIGEFDFFKGKWIPKKIDFELEDGKTFIIEY